MKSKIREECRKRLSFDKISDKEILTLFLLKILILNNLAFFLKISKHQKQVLFTIFPKLIYF